MSMLQLNPTIPVLCKEHGYGDAFIISDVSIDVNPIYHVRFPGGIVKHFYSDDIRIVGNPMNGAGWDVKEFENKDVVNKIPKNAKRNTDFLKEHVIYHESETLTTFLLRIDDSGEINVVLEPEEALIFKSKDEVEAFISINPNLKEYKSAPLSQFIKTK